MKGEFEFDYPGPLAWTLLSGGPVRCQACGKEVKHGKRFRMLKEIESQIYEIVYHLDCAKPYLKVKGKRPPGLQQISPCCRVLFKQMKAQNITNTSTICDGCGMLWIQHIGGEQ